MSKMNFTPMVSISELRKMIPLIGSELTIVVQSEPGCGKTSLLGMMEQDHGDKYDYIYVDCPVKDMSDIGMTIPNHASKTLDTMLRSCSSLIATSPR